MFELTRTLRQWRATARHLELRSVGRRDLAEQIRWAFPADPNAPRETPVTVAFPATEAAVIERLVPVGVWWMPGPARLMRQPGATAGGPAEAVAAAEAIIAAHQRRSPGGK